MYTYQWREHSWKGCAMFSKSQEMAIAHFKGPAIVLAGPGSGKTTVITHRVKNLINKFGVNPSSILVVTFTKAAAENMRLRFKSLMAGRVLPVSFGTFHSVFFKILRTEKDYRPDSLLSDNEKIEILKEIIVRLKIDVSSKKEFVMDLMDEIQIAKGNMINLDEYEPKTCDKEIFIKVFDEYEKEKYHIKKLDFEDMLRMCFQLFNEKPAILKKWRSIYEYILVDEFQDINRLQFEIIKMLSYPQNNIFIVGDDDQSIYGFRGSHPELMFEFEEYYSDSKKMNLSDNYRSTKQIVKMANRLIVNNNKRFEKDIKAVGEEGVKPDIRIYKTSKDEIVSTCNMIKGYIKKGIKEGEIAVLVRNNSLIPIIKQIFESMEVPIVNLKKDDFGRSSFVLEDIMMYLKCSLTWNNNCSRDLESLIHVLNKPSRLISREVVLEKEGDMESVKSVYAHDKSTLRIIDDFCFHMGMIKKMNPYGAVNYIKNVVEYEKYLMNYANEKGVLFKKLNNELDRIQVESEKYKSIEEWIESLTKQQDSTSVSTKGVNVLTMHRSKGLEFEVVFILNVNQGIIPSSKSVREQDFEEERRVFYVDMTRAKKYLHIFLMGENLDFKMEPSMFLNEIIN